jgi:hypothetical protein
MELCESPAWKNFARPALEGKRAALINEWLVLEDPTSIAAAELRAGIRAIDIFLRWQNTYDKAVQQFREWTPTKIVEEEGSGGPY